MENNSNRRWVYFFVGIIAAGFIVIYLPIEVSRSINFTAKVIPVKTFSVYYDRDGRVATELINNISGKKKLSLLTFDRGDDYSIQFGLPKNGIIRKDDTLAYVKSIKLETELLESENRLSELKAIENELIAGAKKSKLEEIRANLSSVQSEYDNQLKIKLRADSLYAKGLISSEELEAAETLANVLKFRIEAEQARLNYFSGGARIEELETAKIRIADEIKKLNLLRFKLRMRTLVSPFESASSYLSESPDTLIRLIDRDKFGLIFPVKLIDGLLLKKGMRGEIYSRGDSLKFVFKITNISDKVFKLNNTQVLMIKAQIADSVKNAVIPGEFLHGEIYVGKEGLMNFIRRQIH
jgi:hypothetical protein